jgi:opacity protein-like surface antigen
MSLRALRALCAVGTFALIPAVAGAQDSKPISVGVMGGLSLPVGDLGDGFDSGYNITGNIYLKPAASRFSFRGDVGYESFGAKVNNSIAGVDLNILSVTGNILFPLSSSMAEGSIRPYLIGGGGLYRSKVEGTGAASGESESSNDLGIGVGGGLEFKLAGFSTFAEARFVNVFGDGDSDARWIPITFGIRF